MGGRAWGGHWRDMTDLAERGSAEELFEGHARRGTEVPSEFANAALTMDGRNKEGGRHEQKATYPTSRIEFVTSGS